MIYKFRGDIKTYDELAEEAVANIRLYSEEWTDYNESDPGITMLQNFAAFHVLQQESIYDLTSQMKGNLLALAGFKPGINRPGRVLLESIVSEEEKDLFLPPLQKLYVGDLCFETTKEEILGPGHLTDVLLFENEEWKVVTYLQNSASAHGIPVFGEKPAIGNGICLVFFKLPGPGETVSVYWLAKEEGRNPFDEEQIPQFAVLSWQCRTEDGWTAMRVADETGYFLRSGCVTFTLPKEKAVRSSEGGKYGYHIRCILKENSYDVFPEVSRIYDHLLEVKQQNTVAASFCLSGNQIELFNGIVREGCFEVFVKESPEDGYRRYKEGQGIGRFYRIISQEPGRLCLEFDPDACHYGPCSCADSVRIVCYSSEILPHRSLGLIYGYEDQVIEIEEVRNVIFENFCLLAEVKGEDKEPVYYFVRPGSGGSEEPGYELLMKEGNIRIHDPGSWSECRLYLSDCSTTVGDHLSIRRGSRITGDGKNFTVVDVVDKGESYRTVEELAEQFFKEADHPAGAVLPSDYETLVYNVPGLMIDKVKAWNDPQKEIVMIAVKPGSRKERPSLSPLYAEQIRSYLEPRRMITSRFSLTGPRYAAIPVYGRIYRKNRYEFCEEIIRDYLKRRFKELAGEAGFGGVIHFGMLFAEIQGLECVDYIHELKALPRGDGASLHGSDILLENDCLGYLGAVDLEIHTGGNGAWQFR